jgi:hypothetical protein
MAVFSLKETQMDTIISRFYGSSEGERDANAYRRAEHLAQTPKGAQMVLTAYENPARRALIEDVHPELVEAAVQTLMMEVAGHPQGAQVIWDLSQSPITGVCMEEYPEVLACAVRTLFDQGRLLLAGKLI